MDCKGLASRVWVFGQGRRDSDLELVVSGVRELRVGVFVPL